jgi:hypothetical protein
VKRQHKDETEAIISDIRHPESTDYSHDTSDEDDDDPRPAKRRKLPIISTSHSMHNPKHCVIRSDSVTPPSATQHKRDELQHQANHGHPSTLIGNDRHHTPRTPHSPSVTHESVPVAEFQEWPFQVFFKRTRIGNETTYNLEFKLPCISERLNLLVFGKALGTDST